MDRHRGIYFCKINDIERSEKTYSGKGGRITETILKSPAGATRLNLKEAGVKELIDLLDSMGSKAARST
jgi:hypothetical protein